MSTDQISVQISSFKADLLERNVSVVIRRYITFGNCFILNDDKYFELKSEIAENFKLHPSEVIIVGSGKLGFSIAAQKRYRSFGDTSDIDVAIISPQLFDQFWKEIFDYSNSGAFWADSEKFKKYLFKGWIRPDKLPNSPYFSLRKDWFEFFRNLTQSGKYGSYKISAGLYKSWHFLEEYQSICVKECKQELESPL
jgi:hypothetical protein